jgi:hypothetical protein
MLSAFVPRTYTLTGTQRRHARPAVTAWATWSGAYRSLPDAEAELLTDFLPEALDNLDAAYDDPDFAEDRSYLTDVASSDADVTWLAEIGRRRWFAIPPAEERDAGWAEPLDAGDPAVRGAYAAAEFAECELHNGQKPDEFLAAVQRVIEEIWTGDPPATWDHGQRLLAAGVKRHEVIHTLADLEAAT